MFFPIIVLLSALSISVIAAYYSIIGLTTIFSGAVIAVAIMGSALEIGKIVTATWLHNNWSVAPWLMKIYLTLAVLVLMFITSMGIFGYLSKSHITQGSPMSVVQSKIAQIDFALNQEENKIIIEQKNITSAQKVLDQLDKSMELYFDKGIIRRALREREKQQEERKQVQHQIDISNNNIKDINLKISVLTTEKFTLNQKVKNFEVEVGPIKYIAELAYGKTNTEILDKSVRWIILTLIFVFDPLAILLILAANISFKQYRDARGKKSLTVEVINTPAPDTNNTSVKQVLNKHIEEQLNNKEIEEPELFTAPFQNDEDLINPYLEYVTKNQKDDVSNINIKETNNVVINNWEDEADQDDLYVDIPPKNSHIIKVKLKEKNNQEQKTSEHYDENYIKPDDIIQPTNVDKDVIIKDIELQNNGTKLAIPEKIAEQYKLASQEVINTPVTIIYKPIVPSKEHLNNTIQDVFNRASTSPQMPYNLESESGAFLKKLLVVLEQQLKNLK